MLQIKLCVKLTQSRWVNCKTVLVLAVTITANDRRANRLALPTPNFTRIPSEIMQYLPNLEIEIIFHRQTVITITCPNKTKLLSLITPSDPNDLPNDYSQYRANAHKM